MLRAWSSDSEAGLTVSIVTFEGTGLFSNVSSEARRLAGIGVCPSWDNAGEELGVALSKVTLPFLFRGLLERRGLFFS